MKLFLCVVPLLVLNLGSYVLIKLIKPESVAALDWSQLGLVVLLGVVYTSQTLFWLWVGKQYQLSYIYPFMGINYILSLVVGMLAFREPFSWQATIGSAIIMAGVLLISSSPHRDELNAERSPA
jgi:drug/metabolite transporter (DMT)-like permease